MWRETFRTHGSMIAMDTKNTLILDNNLWISVLSHMGFEPITPNAATVQLRYFFINEPRFNNISNLML